MKRFLKDPVFHFIILAVGCFALFYSAPREAAVDAPENDFEIIIPAEKLTSLVQQFAQSWRRPPTQKELESLVSQFVREEILVREAMALGFGQNDAVIRQRLNQKMKFLTDSIAQAQTPNDADLQAHLESESKRFEIPDNATFEQVFLGETVTDDGVKTALAALNEGLDKSEVGERSLLPSALTKMSEQQIDGQFGTGFYDAIVNVEQNKWVGPIKSGFGYHLVKVANISPSVLPSLDDIKEKVVTDWRSFTAKDFAEKQYEALKSDYTIELPTEADYKQVLSQ